MIHGSAGLLLSTGTGASVGSAAGSSVGSAVGSSEGAAVAVGVGVGGAVTVKAKSPEIGCPSLETTFHRTVTRPDAAPLSGCVTTVPSTTGSPSESTAPDASVTWSSVAPGSVASSPLNVRVSWAGRASSEVSAAGSVDFSYPDGPNDFRPNRFTGSKVTYDGWNVESITRQQLQLGRN